MKKVLWVAFVIPALAAAVGVWREVPVPSPWEYGSVYAIAVNNAKLGYAFEGCGSGPDKTAMLKFENDRWVTTTAPSIHLILPSVAPDGALYAVDDRGWGYVYRFYNSNWKVVGIPRKLGVRTFTSVAAVGANEFWAAGATPTGRCVAARFINEEPATVYDLGPLNDPNRTSDVKLVVPRTASPSSDCYASVHAIGNPFNQNRWFLYVLEAAGGYRSYPFPCDDYYGDGITAYQPGEIRLMLSKIGAGSILYRFANGVFSELATFPERVALESYSTPADGWGRHSPSRVYHWTGGALNPATDLNGDVLDLDMFDAHNGWAVGAKARGSLYVPVMWQYKDEQPAITPTSLGRVKAAFR